MTVAEQSGNKVHVAKATEEGALLRPEIESTKQGGRLPKSPFNSNTNSSKHGVEVLLQGSQSPAPKRGREASTDWVSLITKHGIRRSRRRRWGDSCKNSVQKWKDTTLT